jgi:hypothetical protein
VRAPKSFYPDEFDAFPAAFRQALTKYLGQGGRLFLSGSYIGTELFARNPVDSTRIRFATDVLKYSWRTNHAARTGGLIAVDSTFKSFVSQTQFNTAYHPKIYQAEAPDGIEPADQRAMTLWRYQENNISAAVGFREEYGVVAFGFPFETILSQKDRNKMMQAIFRFLGL